MKIRSKIIVYASLWLIGILLCVNILVYFLFIRIATGNETKTLQHRAEHILYLVEPRILLRPNQESKLQLYLVENSMIRTLDLDGNIINMLHNNDELADVVPKPTEQVATELIRNDSIRILTVRVPIVRDDAYAGTLEFSEVLSSLSDSIQILITILTVSLAGAAVLALLGGITLSRIVLTPITNLVFTMDDIESSLSFKKIPLPDDPKDELYVMTSTFNRMIDRIEESFAAQKRFVSDASHELKTSITIIESYANLLRRWGMEDADTRKEAIDTIHSESVRMRKMTQQMLDLSAAERASSAAPEPLELVAFCRQMARLIEKIYKRKVNVSPQTKELTIHADKMKLKQLLLILLDNALKYSKDAIDIRLETDHDGAVIRVKDYGIGIPPHELDHVFERFYRVDKARARKTGGAGLGLPIAKAIVEEHDGTIQIRSEEGKWTEISVFLPNPR
ncbi:MAG: histidine kinase [Paenibacillaceae bacterium]|nr:histidine kinase [Paenibacillaceae bacterium]